MTLRGWSFPTAEEEQAERHKLAMVNQREADRHSFRKLTMDALAAVADFSEGKADALARFESSPVLSGGPLTEFRRLAELYRTRAEPLLKAQARIKFLETVLSEINQISKVQS